MQELILEEKTTLSPVMKEIYRRLRTNLEFTGIENKVICLTSCMENDGKSSVSFNLAKCDCGIKIFVLILWGWHRDRCHPQSISTV